MMNFQRTPSLTIFIGSWLTVNIVFLAGEVVLRYGALSGLLMIVSFLLAFIFVIPFLKMSFQLEGHSFLYNVTQSMILLRSLIINCLIWYLLISYDLIPIYYVVGIVLLVVLIQLYFFKKWPRIEGFIYMTNGFLLFCLAILLPNNLYLQVGLETVYHNLLHYHPRTLHLSPEGEWHVFVLLLVVFFVNFFMYIPILKQYMGRDFKVGIRKLFIGITIIATLILAFSTVSIVAVTHDIKADFFNATLLLLIDKQTTTSFVFTMIFFIIYMLLIFEILISYYVFKSQWKSHSSKRGMAFAVASFISGLIILLMVYFNVSLSVLSIYIFFGIGTSLITIILLILTFKHYKVKKI